MSDYNRIKSVPGRVAVLEREQEHGKHFEDYDPAERPGPPDNVKLEFSVREKKTELRYKAKVSWDPFTPDADVCAADILQFEAQLRPCSEAGVEIEAGRHKFGSYTVNDPDDLEADTLSVHFDVIEHPRNWHWQARVRIIDLAGRKGEWSPWTEPLLPHDAARPEPPMPQNLTLTFDKNEKDRHEPRWRARVKFDEINFWDVPPTAQASKIESTAAAAINIGENTINIGDTSGWAAPNAGEPLSGAIRPGKKSELEVFTYTGKTGTHLTGVKRGREGTAEAFHPNGAKVVSSKQDQQEKQNDLQKYEVQLRKCDSAGTFLTDSDNKYIQRTVFKPWKSEEDDNDSKVLCVFPNVRKRHYWKARARTWDRYNRNGEWTAWSNLGSPSDTTPPPQPNSLTVTVDNHKVHVDFESEPDVDDPDVPHVDIAYYQVELHSNASFTALVKKDYYLIATKKTFKVKKASVQYWARARSVDASGNKSAWLTSNANKNRPPQPSAPTISFDDSEEEKGAKLRGIISFTYDETAYNEDHIDRFKLEAIITTASTYTGNEGRRKGTIEADGDSAEVDANDPKSWIIKGLPRHKWIRARVRAIDKNNRKSQWSAWSSSFQISDATAPPAPTNVTVSSDVKGVSVDWDAPTDANDTESDATDSKGADPRINYYQVEVHTNSSFTNRVARDRHQVTTKKRFKGLNEGGTYYARVRSVSSTGTKSGWAGSNGHVSAPIVDSAQIVDDAVLRQKIDADAVGTSELDDTGALVGIGTWKNSSGSTRIEISTADLPTISLWWGGQAGRVWAASGVLGLECPGAGTKPALYLQDSGLEFQIEADEIVGAYPGKGRCGLQVPASVVGAGEIWGEGVSYSGVTKLNSVPSSVTFTTVGTDSNVASVTASDFSARGFMFKMTTNAAGTFTRANRDFVA